MRRRREDIDLWPVRAARPSQFHRLGFAPSYEVVIKPEHPADGIWRYPLYEFALDGTARKPGRINNDLVVGVAPQGGTPWVAVFNGGASGGNVYACPNSAMMCVITDEACLIDAHSPTSGAQEVLGFATHAEGVTDLALLTAASPA